MFNCTFCNEEYETLEGLDVTSEGFFCEYCDSFSMFDESLRSKFVLLLESDNKVEEKVFKKIPKFNKRLSPLRYPGGKSKAIDQLYLRLSEDKLDTLCSPFTGGASFELALLEANVVKKLILNDKDFGIYSLYHEILNNPERLIKRISEATFSTDLYFEFRDIIKNKFENCSVKDAAFYTLCNNRMAYSGILKANPLGGRNANMEQLMSRFNIKDIIKRIMKINNMKKDIEIYNEDALDIIEEYYWGKNTTLFIDPPYFCKGEALYVEYYKNVDHLKLSLLLESLSTGTPGTDILITYDNSDEIRSIYPNANKIDFGRSYSI